MSVKQDLASIAGSEHVSDDLETRRSYGKDYSLVPPRMPSLVAFPGSTEEIQGIVRYANQHSMGVTPRSSRVSFYGAGIPYQGGIIIDLTRMNRILEVDPEDRIVRVEPGVTWSQLRDELQEYNMMVCHPLLPHPLKSALTSAMEREPILIPKQEYGETFLTGEMVLASGELFWTGSAIGKGLRGRSNPEAFIPSNRLFMGAQGTLGVMTWATLKTVYLPAMDKLFFVPFDRIEEIAEPVYRIQRLLLGNECLVLNRFNLATILSGTGIDSFESLRERLPRYTLLICLSGQHRHPEGRIAYEEEALLRVSREWHFEAASTVAGIAGLREKVVPLLRKPWPADRYWKFLYKGACQEIFFHTPLNRVSEFTRAIEGLALKHEYATADIGLYVQPIDRATVAFCQYGFPYRPDQTAEAQKVQRLYLEASEMVLNMGGVFTTPYGPWADMVYRRAAGYTAVMKVVKDAFDPKGIMNPGKLCF